MASRERRQRNPYRRERGRNNHSSRRNSAAAIAGLLGLLAVWYLTPISEYVIQAVLMFVPMESDIDLGREAWRNMAYPIVSDEWGVKHIGYQLVSELDPDKARIPWSFSVIHANFINAFALPGGIIRVTDSLLQKMNLSDSELAALLGHEMGHIIHRHSQAQILQQHALSYVLQALFYEDNDGYQETFGEAVGELLLKSATYLGRQSFSRKNEYQADAMAWELLLHSKKYSPMGLESLLHKLLDQSGDDPLSGITTFLSTHPGTKDRIEALKMKWEELPLGQRQRLML